MVFETIISAFQIKDYLELKSNILASDFIIQLNNRNIKVNGATVSLQNFQWKLESIMWPNSPNDNCTVEFISRKMFASHRWTCMLTFIFNRTEQNKTKYIYIPTELLFALVAWKLRVRGGVFWKFPLQVSAGIWFVLFHWKVVTLQGETSEHLGIAYKVQSLYLLNASWVISWKNFNSSVK